MASLNKVILIGRLGRDPEILSFENGSKKMSVSIATTESYHDAKGNLMQHTEWHNLVSFGDIAKDIAEKKRNYIKGDLVYVEGRLRHRQYIDSLNIKRVITEVYVDKMMALNTARNTDNRFDSYYKYGQSSDNQQDDISKF